MKNNKRKSILCFALAGLLLIAAWGIYSQSTQQQLAGKMVRLHVLANSDSREDQQRKLLVKEAVYAKTEELLRKAGSQQEAVTALEAAIPQLTALAQETLRQCGSEESVSVRVEETDFPTKEYDGFVLPAGRYLALRVLIGEAQGQNWWCVVFPPLCSAGAEQLPQAARIGGLTGQELRLITEQDGSYVLRFRLVELWQKFQLWLRNF